MFSLPSSQGIASRGKADSQYRSMAWSLALALDKEGARLLESDLNGHPERAVRRQILALRNELAAKDRSFESLVMEIELGNSCRVIFKSFDVTSLFIRPGLMRLDSLVPGLGDYVLKLFSNLHSCGISVADDNLLESVLDYEFMGHTVDRDFLLEQGIIVSKDISDDELNELREEFEFLPEQFERVALTSKSRKYVLGLLRGAFLDDYCRSILSLVLDIELKSKRLTSVCRTYRVECDEGSLGFLGVLAHRSHGNLAPHLLMHHGDCCDISDWMIALDFPFLSVRDFELIAATVKSYFSILGKVEQLIYLLESA